MSLLGCEQGGEGSAMPGSVCRGTAAAGAEPGRDEQH